MEIRFLHISETASWRSGFCLHTDPLSIKTGKLEQRKRIASEREINQQ